VSYFAVIDTETNWSDQVMSIGIAIGESTQYNLVDTYYYVLDPEFRRGGVFASSLRVEDNIEHKYKSSRKDAMTHVLAVLKAYKVEYIFAYNATFDYFHLPELKQFRWIDILKLAAYKQHNRFIPEEVDCYPTSGRIKRGYGVEPIYRMVTGTTSYREKHNGLYDAIDELVIMRKLDLSFDHYLIGEVKKPNKTENRPIQ